MSRLELRFSADLKGSLNDMVKDDYFDLLCNDLKMTTEEFVAACRIIRRDRYKFPIPKDFKEAIRLSIEDEVLLEWQKIITFLKLPPGSREELNLSPAGLTAYRGMGGRELAEKDLTNSFLVKDFSAFVKAAIKKLQIDSDLTRARLMLQSKSKKNDLKGETDQLPQLSSL